MEKEKRKKWLKEYRAKERKTIIQLLGGKCVFCGFNDFRALQVDHIKGGGSKERKFKKSYNSYYLLKEILSTDWRYKYQLLCANCNWIKRYNSNENRK